MSIFGSVEMKMARWLFAGDGLGDGVIDGDV